MIRHLFLAVSYKSYDCLEPFVRSIDEAALCDPNVDVTVAIGDNTDSDWQQIAISTQRAHLRVFDYHENAGYLGCAFQMIRDLKAEGNFDFDFVTISNVDVQIDATFFQKLDGVNLEDVGWVAPDIFTPSRDHHENPFMSNRPTSMSFLKWFIMYANSCLYGLMEQISYSVHRANPAPHGITDIYAGHGSFMTFTRQFFERHAGLAFPTFMYGEELFFAELVRRDGLKVRVFPDVKVYNVGSVSVSVLGNKWKCRNNRKSLWALYNQYFR